MLRFVCLVAISAVAVSSPVSSGKWVPEKYGNAGRYTRPRDEGKYKHVPNPYIHIDNPYDGGYGPYAHQNEPYEGAESIPRYQIVLKPGEENPYFKEGYYRNNGIKIISQQHNYEEDKYDFNFETENKIRAEEKAEIRNPNAIDEGIASKGFYEYIGPDGYMYRVEYTADEKGFRPKMTRLETPYSGKWVREKIN